MPNIYADGTLLSANGEFYIMVAGERQKITDPELVRELKMDTAESGPASVSAPAVITLSKQEIEDPRGGMSLSQLIFLPSLAHSLAQTLATSSDTGFGGLRTTSTLKPITSSAHLLPLPS